MKIKVCGMRDSDNISELVKLSPDFIGFIFYEKSKRFVVNFPKVEIPKSIKKVGIFVNESIEDILQKVIDFQLDVVQLHGDETPEFCNELKTHKVSIIKAFAVEESFNFNKTKAYEQSCELFLFDTKGKEYGGNGVKYNWNILQKYKGDTQFLLSGGITEEDVESIKEFKHSKFIGVDLNSGFEDAPAQKNIKKLKTFKSKLNV